MVFKETNYFGVPLAPTFWKLLTGEEPSLVDFAREDARLAKRLANLNKNSAFLAEKWEWRNSEDEILPLEIPTDEEAKISATEEESK